MIALVIAVVWAALSILVALSLGRLVGERDAQLVIDGTYCSQPVTRFR